MRSKTAPKVNLESTSPHDGQGDPASHICGYTDEINEVSILTQPLVGCIQQFRRVLHYDAESIDRPIHAAAVPDSNKTKIATQSA
jgi:hypothetical protein